MPNVPTGEVKADIKILVKWQRNYDEYFPGTR